MLKNGHVRERDTRRLCKRCVHGRSSQDTRGLADPRTTQRCGTNYTGKRDQTSLHTTWSTSVRLQLVAERSFLSHRFLVVTSTPCVSAIFFVPMRGAAISHLSEAWVRITCGLQGGGPVSGILGSGGGAGVGGSGVGWSVLVSVLFVSIAKITCCRVFTCSCVKRILNVTEEGVTFYDLGNVHDCNDGISSIHGRELPEQLSIHCEYDRSHT